MTRNRIITAAVVLLLLLLGFGLLNGRHDSIQTVTSLTLSDNLDSIAYYPNNSLMVVQSGEFRAYDINSQKRTVLSQSLRDLDNSDSVQVSSDGKYILFHLTRASEGTALGNQLAARNLDTGKDYWWLYSIQNKTYSPLEPGTLTAQFYGDTITSLRLVGTSEQLVLYDTKTTAVDGRISTATVSDFAKASSGYVVIINSQASYTTDGVVYRVIGPADKIVGASSDGRVVWRTGSKLIQFDSKKQSTKILASHVYGSQVWSNNSFVYTTYKSEQLTASTQHLWVYDMAKNTKVEWRLDKKLNQKVISPVSLLASKAVVLKDDTESIYLVVAQH
ncbi:hypothetical protein KDA23_06855 [Candidatus Saccharibacteria bacterium]|nr:hypothetical protein [Candidatus Saccharibacteria bacterium]